jgi:hypothetical protein
MVYRDERLPGCRDDSNDVESMSDCVYNELLVFGSTLQARDHQARRVESRQDKVTVGLKTILPDHSFVCE